MAVRKFTVLAVLAFASCLGQESRFGAIGQVEGEKCPALYVSMAGLGLLATGVEVPNPCTLPGDQEGVPSLTADLVDPPSGFSVTNVVSSNTLSFKLTDAYVGSPRVVTGTYKYTLKDPEGAGFVRTGALHVLFAEGDAGVVTLDRESPLVRLSTTLPSQGAASGADPSIGAVGECLADGSRCTALVAQDVAATFQVDADVWALAPGCPATIAGPEVNIAGSTARNVVACVVVDGASLVVDRVGASGGITAEIGGQPRGVSFGVPFEVPGGTPVLLGADPGGRIDCVFGRTTLASNPGESVLMIPELRGQTRCTVSYGSSVRVSVGVGGAARFDGRTCASGDVCIGSTESDLVVSAVPEFGYSAQFSGVCSETSLAVASIEAGTSGDCFVSFLADPVCVPPTYTLELRDQNGDPIVDACTATPGVLDVSDDFPEFRFQIAAGWSPLPSEVSGLYVDGVSIADFEGVTLALPSGEFVSNRVLTIAAGRTGCGQLMFSNSVFIRRMPAGLPCEN